MGEPSQRQNQRHTERMGRRRGDSVLGNVRETQLIKAWWGGGWGRGAGLYWLMDRMFVGVVGSSHRAGGQLET